MERSKKSRVLDMTKGKVLHLLLCFALPLFLGNLLQQLYNLADTSISGHMLGDGSLAQIGATSALYGLITNFAFGMNNGLALSVSRHFSAGEKEEMKKSVCWMVLLSLVSATFLTVSSLVCRNLLMDLLQVPAETREGALSYLAVILTGIPLTMIYNLESALLQAVGNSVTPLLLLFLQQCFECGSGFSFYGTFWNGSAWRCDCDCTCAGGKCRSGISLYLEKLTGNCGLGKGRIKGKHTVCFYEC